MRAIALLALLPSIALADVRWFNNGADAGIITTINCAAGAVCSRSGSAGTITIVLDGGVLAGTAPITVTPGSPTLIGCIMATGSVSGCMSTTTQTIAGHKTWTDAQTFNSQIDIQATSVVRGGLIFLAPSGGSFQQQTTEGSFDFQDNLGATSVSSGVTFESTAHRTSGFVLSGGNGIYTTFKNDVGGNVFSGCGYNPDGGSNYCGGFVDGSGISGNLSLTAAENFYPFVAGRLPTNYCGDHGAVTMGNTHADPLWLLEIYNPETGTAADIKTIINYQGGIAQPAGYSLSQFAPCGNFSMCPADGGNRSDDAGYAFDGTLMYAHDTQKWYFCYIPGGVGAGTWQPVDTTGAAVTSVTASGNIASSGGTTPNITFTGVLPIANGGTNSGTALPAAGGVVWNTGTTLVPIAAGSTGECLRSNGASAPFFGTCDILDGGQGSVSDFSFTNANGVAGVVTNSTTTPNLTISLNAITPTTIVASSTIAGSNLSGTNTGNVTLASFGSTPATEGASLSSQVLTLQPADGAHGGGVSTTTQTFAGAKTFSTPIALNSGGTNNNIAANYGAIPYSDASKLLLSGVGSVGQCFLSGGAGAPTWGACGTTSGTVTSVSVTTHTGVSGTVATATTTPAISITLGAITPTSVNTTAGAITGGAITANTSFNIGSSVITDDTTFTTISNPIITQYLNTTVAGLDMGAAASNIIQSDTTDTNTSPTVAAMEFGQSQTLTSGDLSFGWKTGSTRLCKMANTGAFNCIGAMTGSNLSGTNTGDQTITLTGDVTGSGTGSFATTYAGTVPVAKGGTNLTAATDDNVMVGNGTTWQSKAVPNCTDTAGQHLNYTSSSNTFSCGSAASNTASYHVGGGVPDLYAKSTDFASWTAQQAGTAISLTCTSQSITGSLLGTTFAARIYDRTANAQLCVCTVQACTVSVGTSASCSCSGAITAGHTYALQVDDTTNCNVATIAHVPQYNCNADITVP